MIRATFDNSAPYLLVKRYEQLIRVLENLPAHEKEHHFQMVEWFKQTDCGTAMCAAGWAGSDKWFKKRGFQLMTPDSITRPFPQFGHHQGWNAVNLFFEGRTSVLAPLAPLFDARKVFDQPVTIPQVIAAAKQRIAHYKAIMHIHQSAVEHLS